jgi:hypothetical protein
VTRARSSVYALAAGIALLSASHAIAQVPGLSAQQRQDGAQIAAAREREEKLEVLGSWLKRLSGRFRVTGTWSVKGNNEPPRPEPLKGDVDCVLVGTGPGVHCMTSLTASGFSPDGSFPAMSLYGLDLDALGIHFLQVDNHSIAERGLGAVEGDVATITVKKCQWQDYEGYPAGFSSRTISCERVIRIVAPAGGESIQLQIRTNQRHRGISPDAVHHFDTEELMDLRLQRLP